MSQLTISFIETGKTESPQKATVEAIEKVLGKLPGKIQSEIAEEAKVEGIGEYRGPFPIDEYKDNVQDSTEGIYVFYDSLKRPVRVGQTDDLKRRIFEYKRDTWWCRPPTVESFAYIIVKDAKLRRQVESTMIKLVGDNAIFNIQHKI
jgi:transcriptional regulator with XRE-family HTH domain